MPTPNPVRKYGAFSIFSVGTGVPAGPAVPSFDFRRTNAKRYAPKAPLGGKAVKGSCQKSLIFD